MSVNCSSRSLLVALVLGLLIIPPLAATRTGAFEPTVLEAFGCVINPSKPENIDGNLVARATVSCSTEMDGRYVETAIEQKALDGTWREIRPSAIMLDVSEQQAVDDADGVLIDCKTSDNARKMRTVIEISDGQGNSNSVASLTEDFMKNCAGADTVPISPAGRNGVEQEICNGCGGVDYTFKEFYGCDVRAYFPYRFGADIVGKAKFDCNSPMDERLVYVVICIDQTWSFSDACYFPAVSKMLPGAKSKALTQRCPSHNTSNEVDWTYTRVGIDPKPSGGNDPRDKFIKSDQVRIEYNHRVCDDNTVVPTPV